MLQQQLQRYPDALVQYGRSAGWGEPGKPLSDEDLQRGVRSAEQIALGAGGITAPDMSQVSALRDEIEAASDALGSLPHGPEYSHLFNKRESVGNTMAAFDKLLDKVEKEGLSSYSLPTEYRRNPDLLLQRAKATVESVRDFVGSYAPQRSVPINRPEIPEQMGIATTPESIIKQWKRNPNF